MRGLVLNAPDNIVIAAEIERLSKAGVAVVTYNSDLPNSTRVCHVGQDLMKSGKIAAGLMARSLSPKDRILELAKKIPAHMIIIASHRPDITTYLLGSNAAAVVRHAECSVLVVR